MKECRSKIIIQNFNKFNIFLFTVSVEVDRTESDIKVECVKEEKGESEDDDFDDRPDFGDDDDYDDCKYCTFFLN